MLFLINGPLKEGRGVKVRSERAVTGVLTISSRPTVLRVVRDVLGGSKRLIAGMDGPLGVGVRRLRHCSLVLLSVVVPKVSNFRLYGEVEVLISYPVLFLATGARRGDLMGKLSLKTSSCVSGPFKIVRLQTEVGTRLEERRERRSIQVILKEIYVRVSRGGLLVGSGRLPLAGTRCRVYRFLTGGEKRIFSGRRVLRTIFNFSGRDGSDAVVARVGGVETGFTSCGCAPVGAI